MTNILVTSVRHKNLETERVETRLMLHRRIHNVHASLCMYPQIFKQFLSADLDFDTSTLFLDIRFVRVYNYHNFISEEGMRGRENKTKSCLPMSL